MSYTDRLWVLRWSLYNTSAKYLFQKVSHLVISGSGYQYSLALIQYYSYSVFQNQIERYRDHRGGFEDRIYRRVHFG